jgi:hypothetical protein
VLIIGVGAFSGIQSVSGTDSVKSLSQLKNELARPNQRVIAWSILLHIMMDWGHLSVCHGLYFRISQCKKASCERKGIVCQGSVRGVYRGVCQASVMGV